MIVLLFSAYVVEVRKEKERKGGKVKGFFLSCLYHEDPEEKNFSISFILSPRAMDAELQILFPRILDNKKKTNV